MSHKVKYLDHPNQLPVSEQEDVMFMMQVLLVVSLKRLGGALTVTQDEWSKVFDEIKGHGALEITRSRGSVYASLLDLPYLPSEMMDEQSDLPS